MKRTTLFGLTAIGLFVGGITWMYGRPARLQAANLTRLEADTMPGAEISLTYSRGLRPAHAMIDVSSTAGQGSTMAGGDDDIAQVPLDRPLEGQVAISVTTTSRLLGRLQVQQYHFSA